MLYCYTLSFKNSIVTLLEVTQLTFVFPGWSLSFRFTCQPFVHNLGIEQKQAPASWPVSCCVAWSPHLGIDSQTLTLDPVSQWPFAHACVFVTHSCLVISWIILIETPWVWSWWHSGHCPYRAPLTWSVSLDPEKLPDSAQLQTWPSLSPFCALTVAPTGEYLICLRVWLA